MAKRRALKPKSKILAEHADKIRVAFAKMKDEGMGTEDAVHSLRVKYKLALRYTNTYRVNRLCTSEG